MSSIAQVSETMQRILTSRAKELERESGFVERSSAQLDGPTFSQTTVLTWMHTAEASYTQVRHTAASLGVQVSNQAIEQRFSAASARLLRALLEEAVGQVISSEANAPEVLARFTGVYLQDGTVISLPASLAHEWPGHGQAGQEAALRVQGRLELGSGCLAGLWLQAGSEAERSGPAISTPLPVGSLFNADMGYFTLQEMRQRGTLEQYWLTQAKATLTVIDHAGHCWDLLSFLQAQRSDEVEVEVFVGKRERLPVRLIAVQEALVLLRCRWQIELLWKLWKQHGKLDTWRSSKPERILTELYAKLLGLIITHWELLLGCWQAPNRSLLKATQVVQWMTPCLALALTGLVPVPTIVERTAQMMQTGCTINSRRKWPNTHQLLADPRLVRSLG
jgi:DDE family transposase